VRGRFGDTDANFAKIPCSDRAFGWSGDRRPADRPHAPAVIAVA